MLPPSPHSLSSSKYKVSETYFGTNSLLCKNGCPAIDERERKGFGIYFVSYSSDNATALKYYDEAAKSARLLKSMSPDVHSLGYS